MKESNNEWEDFKTCNLHIDWNTLDEISVVSYINRELEEHGLTIAISQSDNQSPGMVYKGVLVDWSILSKLGIVEFINREVLIDYNLAVFWGGETFKPNHSGGAYMNTNSKYAMPVVSRILPLTQVTIELDRLIEDVVLYTEETPEMKIINVVDMKRSLEDIRLEFLGYDKDDKGRVVVEAYQDPNYMSPTKKKEWLSKQKNKDKKWQIKF